MTAPPPSALEREAALLFEQVLQLSQQLLRVLEAEDVLDPSVLDALLNNRAERLERLQALTTEGIGSLPEEGRQRLQAQLAEVNRLEARIHQQAAAVRQSLAQDLQGLHQAKVGLSGYHVAAESQPDTPSRHTDV